MLPVEQRLEIRLRHRDGQSVRQIARELGHSRKAVKKALQEGPSPGYHRQAPAPCPKLGPFLAVIEEILAGDAKAPPKQRHTAMRIFQRLREEQRYAGSYDPVRRYVQKQRRKHQQTFVPLEVVPGERLECDFGHIQVDFPEGRRQVPVLLAVWSFSQYAFAIALPDETWGSILHGLVLALEFFGAVPRELWWDNPRTLAQRVLRGRDRQVNPQYLALASHYCFAPKFCQPAKGQEKSDVERTVFALQRRFATPVPQVQDLEALNRHLLCCCLRERQRRVRGRSEPIGVQFQQDAAAALPLPARPFDACTIHPRQADKYQCVTFEDVHYSVPHSYAFCPVTLKAYPAQVVLVHADQVIARHARSRRTGEHVLDPRHFLKTLELKPAYLEKTRLFKELRLPPVFADLHQHLIQRWGEREGKRQYLQVLQLLASHSPEDLAQAIITALQAGPVRAGVIGLHLQTPIRATRTDLPNHEVAVPLPDLGRYNQLLSGPQEEQENGYAPSNAAVRTEP